MLAQGRLVSLTADHRPPVMTISALLSVALAAAWLFRGRLAHLDVLVATAAVGGLAMVAAEHVTGGHSHAGMSAHTPHTEVVGTGAMLVACAAACRWTCDPLCGGRWPHRLLAHVVAGAAMVAGMLAAERTAVSRSLTAPAAHLAMVLGMTLGVAAVLPILRLTDGHALRAPEVDRMAA